MQELTPEFVAAAVAAYLAAGGRVTICKPGVARG